MGRSGGHPRAEPDLWPLIAMAVIVACQVAVLQVAINRLAWGMYRAVMPPAVAVMVLAVLAWMLYRQLDRDAID